MTVRPKGTGSARRVGRGAGPRRTAGPAGTANKRGTSPGTGRRPGPGEGAVLVAHQVRALDRTFSSLGQEEQRDGAGDRDVSAVVGCVLVRENSTGPQEACQWPFRQ